MKVVHRKNNAYDHLPLPEQAMHWEKEKEWEKAAGIYRELVEKHPHKEKYYDRLLIMYRRLKDHKKEIQVLNRGIKVFEEFHRRSSHPVTSKNVIRLSKALLRSTGLVDKKGKALFDHEPVRRWKKRKELLVKKIK